MVFHLSEEQKAQVRLYSLKPFQRMHSVHRFSASGERSLMPNSQFEKDGFIVIKGFFTQEWADRLLSKSRKLLKEFDLVSSARPLPETAHQSADALGARCRPLIQ